MTLRGVLAPLVRSATYRRGTYLLLGGVLLLPYVLLGAAFVQLLAGPEAQRPLSLLLLVVTVVIAGVPAFLRGTRALEITAVRLLLDVDLPDPPVVEPAEADRETRLRSALWFAVHLVVGGVVGLGLLIALPMALVFVGQQLGVGDEALTGVDLGPIDETATLWLTVTGLALLVAIGYAVAGLGALAAVMAPVLLGPSPTERIAALEAQAARLGERNRLARDLHDSVGHALTVTTLQAAAAREVLDADPAFVRRALAAIEDTGRGAMADLDHVLGVLRADEHGAAGRDAAGRDGGRPGAGAGADPGGHAPERTLADLGRLAADVRTAGVELDATVTGPVDDVPAAVSREGYRIVQESLTNALRHGGPVPVTVCIAMADGVLGIDVANPAPAHDHGAGLGTRSGARPSAGGGVGRGSGRGLAGIRERVALLGGSAVMGPTGDGWQVSVRLPARLSGDVQPGYGPTVAGGLGDTPSGAVRPGGRP